MKLMLHKLSQGGHIIGVGALTEGEYGLLCGAAYLHVLLLPSYSCPNQRQ